MKYLLIGTLDLIFYGVMVWALFNNPFIFALMALYLLTMTIIFRGSAG